MPKNVRRLNYGTQTPSVFGNLLQFSSLEGNNYLQVET